MYLAKNALCRCSHGMKLFSRNCHVLSAHLSLAHLSPARSKNRPNHLILTVRTIAYNDSIAQRGMAGDFSGLGTEEDLHRFGTFEGMEEFLTDQVPELTVNVIPLLHEMSWWPTVVIAHTFNHIQEITGLPWFATIGICAAFIKLGLYPFHIRWRMNFQDLVKSSPFQVTTFLQTYFTNVLKQGSQEALTLAYKARDEKCIELNVPRFPALGPIYATTLVPLTAVLGLSYLTNLTYEPLLTGGALWFSNLAEPDPYYILPVVNSLLIIANARYHPFGLLLPKPVFVAGAHFQVPLGILTFLQLWCSSGLLVYFISANSAGLIIQLLLRNNSIRELHGLEGKQQVLAPYFEQFQDFDALSNQITSTKTQLLEIKSSEQKLLKDKLSSDKEVKSIEGTAASENLTQS